MDDTGIALDWKAVGRDFLDTLPEIYPDLAFLRCRAFATLRSQLANESADACFDALSGYLRAHEHQLWSVDTGGDAYRLHVVASADADAFASAHGEANGAGCERLASDAPAWKAPKAPRKKPPPLIEATDGHRSYGGLYTSGCEVRHALVPFENDTMLTINSPIWVDGTKKVQPRKPPGLGEHSDEILRNAGYDDAAIAKLRAAGAVA